MTDHPLTKVVHLKLRMSEPLRAKVEAASRVRGGSMNSEINSRLEASFLRQREMFGGSHTMELLKVFAAVIGAIEEQTGKLWTEDEDTASKVNTALFRLIGTESTLLPRDDEFRRQHERDIAVDAIKAFLKFGDFDPKVQQRVAKLIDEED